MALLHKVNTKYIYKYIKHEYTGCFLHDSFLKQIQGASQRVFTKKCISLPKIAF